MRRLLPFTLLLLAGCQAGSGGATGALAGAAPSGAAGEALASTRAQWLVLDLGSGATLATATLDASSPAYRANLVALRLVSGATASLGSAPGTLAAQTDEPPGLAAPAPFYIAALELTRAQWRVLAGSAPWDQLDAPANPTTGEDLPATGITWAEAQAALARWNAGHGAHLALPSAAEWEVTARAGGGAVFPWGDDVRASVVRAYAVTWDTTLGSPGPRPVGGRLANALGLHDLCGNAAELVADGSARGGSWADATSVARPANRLALQSDTRHGAVGLRLAWRP
jgi:formylglycine-generating enzyme required for sulfatase activity